MNALINTAGALCLALWVWSKFFASFPSAPPVNSKMDDPAWHRHADAAQDERTGTLTSLKIACAIIVVIAVMVWLSE